MGLAISFASTVKEKVSTKIIIRTCFHCFL